MNYESNYDKIEEARKLAVLPITYLQNYLNLVVFLF